MDKINLSSLSNPPQWAIVFKGYRNAAIAKQLGITANYLCNLKTGYKTPGKELQLMIDDLCNQILEAESMQSLQQNIDSVEVKND